MTSRYSSHPEPVKQVNVLDPRVKGEGNCARAEHQWDNFLSLPNLRYVNFVHPTVSLEKAVRKFSGRAVLAPIGTNGHKDPQDYVRECLKYFTPETRFAFIINADSLEAAKKLHDELRKIIVKG